MLCCAQSCQTLCDPMDFSPPDSSVHEDSLGKNTGVGCHALLQWIFPTQGVEPSCPALEADSFCLSHQGSPRILEWVAYTSSRVSFQPRNRTRISCIAGGFFTIRVTRKAQEDWSGSPIPSPVDLPDPGIEVGSPALQVDFSLTKLSGKPGENTLPLKKSWKLWVEIRLEFCSPVAWLATIWEFV